MLKQEMCPLAFTDCVLIGKQIFFVEYHIAVLFSMDIDTGRVKYVDRIPGVMIVQPHLICKILNYKNNLILIPARTTSNYIWFYDLEERIWDSISFEDKGIKAPYEQFEYATIHDNELFVVGCYYPALICVDLNNKKTTYYEIFKNDFRMHSLGSCMNMENQLYIPSPISNQVIVFDMELKQYRCHCVGDEKNTFSGITNRGETFWLSPMKNTALVKWDGSDEVTEYKLPGEFQNASGCIFNGIAYYQDEIYVYGLKDKLSFRFLCNQYETYEIIDNSYLLCKKIGGDYLITCDYNGKIQVISAGDTKEYRPLFSEAEMKQIMKEWKKELCGMKDIKLTEDDFIRLDRFLEIL